MATWWKNSKEGTDLTVAWNSDNNVILEQYMVSMKELNEWVVKLEGLSFPKDNYCTVNGTKKNGYANILSWEPWQLAQCVDRQTEWMKKK